MRVESLQSRAISVLIALLLTVAPCLAQSNASLEVIVKDPTGALISKAQVQLIKNGKPQSLNTTNQRGEARFNKLAAGRYQVHIEAAGFKALDLDDVDLASWSTPARSDARDRRYQSRRRRRRRSASTKYKPEWHQPSATS